MSRQSSRMQRWLRGGPEDTEQGVEDSGEQAESSAAQSPGLFATDGPRPRLPERHPDPNRPKVMGLAAQTSQLRMSQVSAQSSEEDLVESAAEELAETPVPVSAPVVVPAIDPYVIDRDVLERLVGVEERLVAVLAQLDLQLDGLHSALLCTKSGAPVAWVGIAADQVESMAVTTAGMHAAAGEDEETELMAVKLKNGMSIIGAAAGTDETPLLMRLTASNNALGLMLLTVQHVVREVTDIVRIAEDEY